MAQCATQNMDAELIVHASASAGTQAGLVFGQRLLNLPGQILGINVFHPDPRTLKDRVLNLAQTMSERWPDACTDAVFEVNVNHAYFGDGYGLPTEACIKAIRLAAQMEGLLFDPVYSGKALAGLIDQINLGNFNHLNDVILIHTGGSASLGAYIDAFDE